MRSSIQRGGLEENLQRLEVNVEENKFSYRSLYPRKKEGTIASSLKGKCRCRTLIKRKTSENLRQRK